MTGDNLDGCTCDGCFERITNALTQAEAELARYKDQDGADLYARLDALRTKLTQAEAGAVGKMITDELDAMRHARDAALAERDTLRATIKRIEALCDEQNRALPAYLLTREVRAALAGDGRD